MELDVIKSTRVVDRGKLDPNQYTVSLLKEGMHLELIDRQTMYNIQGQIMELLKELIMRYTKGDSSSIKVETAEKILNSLYYSIDACLFGYNEPEKALEELKSGSIREIYENGMKLVAACVAEAKALYRKTAGMKLVVPLIAYNTTVDEALPKFFRDYGAVFEAHETVADIDYPLAVDIGNLRGVYYMKGYLEVLNMETRFCRCFSDSDIRKLLLAYGRLSNIDHKEPLVNIFELVINNSLFSVLSGGDAANPIISKSQYELLRKRLTGMNGPEVVSLLNMAVEHMIGQLQIEDEGIIDYIDRYKDLFIQRLLGCVQNDSLSGLVLVEAEKKSRAAATKFVAGNKMSDKSFRSLVEKIMACSDVLEKVSLIKSGISSLEDFTDVLQAGCLYGDEYLTLFETLSDMELAVLSKTSAEETGSGMEWQELFENYIESLDDYRKNAVKAFAGDMGIY